MTNFSSITSPKTLLYKATVDTDTNPGRQSSYNLPSNLLTRASLCRIITEFNPRILGRSPLNSKPPFNSIYSFFSVQNGRFGVVCQFTVLSSR